MNFNFVDYCQYLLKSHTNFTITLRRTLQIENISHDTINRYLRTESLNSEDLWRNVQEEFVSHTEAYLIFDDTVINKKYGYNIELTRRQYSGNEHQVVCVLSAAKFVGLGIVNCVYFNPQNEQLWIIDYRIYDPDTDKKTKIEEC